MRRLKEKLNQKCLKMIGEGLVMSHIRYCSPIYLTDKVKLSHTEPKNGAMEELQILMNKRRESLPMSDPTIGYQPRNYFKGQAYKA